MVEVNLLGDLEFGVDLTKDWQNNKEERAKVQDHLRVLAGKHYRLPNADADLSESDLNKLLTDRLASGEPLTQALTLTLSTNEKGGALSRKSYVLRNALTLKTPGGIHTHVPGAPLTMKVIDHLIAAKLNGLRGQES